jgi:hypothetical protein
MQDKKLRHPVVKSHRTIHVAPQFRPLKRGARRRGLERVYQYQSGAELTIKIFKECDIADQSLLYAILAMCLDSKRGALLSAKPLSDDSKRMRDKLEIRGDVLEHDCLLLKTNKYELNEELGKARSSQNRQWIIDSLKRLSGISFDYEDEKWAWGFNLLSYGYNKETDEITISVNPLSAYVILQDKGYAHLHRGERRELKADESKGLHSVLVGLVNPGNTRIFNVDMLADKVYARYDEEISAQTQKDRRSAIKKACQELSGLNGWEIDVFGRGKSAAAKICRKKTR